MRAIHGDEAMGNHLVLRVDLDEPMLVDTGIGDGILEPIRLEEGRTVQGSREFRLEVMDDGLWRFHNHEGVIPPNFDFTPEPDEDRLARTCRNLQEDADSLFRKNLICMQPDGFGGTKALIGRVLALPGEQKKILEIQ